MVHAQPFVGHDPIERMEDTQAREEVRPRVGGPAYRKNPATRAGNSALCISPSKSGPTAASLPTALFG
jgi:hypothetical protein